MQNHPPGHVLVTGGAGYIGSHAVLSLLAAGWKVTVLDDLSTGSRKLVPNNVSLHVGNVGDQSFTAPLLANIRPDAVIHFAGSISVPESVADPLKYYQNNFGVSCNLIKMCIEANINKFIFSSTAAVYGIPNQLPVTEDAPTQPINPYGRSKLMTELLLKDVAEVTPLRYAILRYFNVAGADAAGRAGQIVRNSTNLIKVVAELATGHRDEITVFGDDYNTADGSGVRDFIHVSDLADAHTAALGYLMQGGSSQILNCGYGSGFSVKQVLAAAKSIVGRPLNYSIGPRRAGDPAEVIADSSRIRQVLGWTPRHADLPLILQNAIAWESGLAS
jgi:UDP-glucose 4-epimerase